jgi:hypothetical protein
LGVLSKVEAGAGIGVAVVAVGGVYYVYKKAPEWFPNGIAAAIGGWLGNLWGNSNPKDPNGPPVTENASIIRFSKNPAGPGDEIHVYVTQLQAYQDCKVYCPQNRV